MKGKQSPYHLFSPSGCLSQQGIQRFLDKQLTEPEGILFQRHIQECNFCKEAVEGLALLPPDVVLESTVTDLKNKLNKLPTISGSRKKKINDRIFYYSAAASIIILVGLLFFFNDQSASFTFDGEQVDEVMIAEKTVPPMPQALAISEDSVRTIDTDIKNINKPAVPKPKKIRPKNTVNKAIPNSFEVPADLRTAQNGLEIFLEKNDEKTITSKRQRRSSYVDIASTLPVEYYLSEIIIEDQAQAISFIAPVRPESRETDALTEEISQNRIIEGPTTSLSNHFFNPVEMMPEFPGGLDGLNEYLSSHLRYPKSARDDKIQGRIIVSFLIDSSGSITNIVILRGIGGACDEEAIRIIREMPAWKPAYQNGQAVSVQFTLPIHFRIL